MIVVDANIIIYLVCSTPHTEMAREVHEKDSQWLVPDLWEAEVLNGLVNMMRSGLLDNEDAIAAWSNAASILSGCAHHGEARFILQTARQSRLTAYDAHYVALARSTGVRLVTEDGAIKTNCPDVAISMKNFLRADDFRSVVREGKPAYKTKRKR